MKRKQKTPEDPGRRIISAAAEVFAAKGYDGARIEEIAERAGINKAMLYYHVGDKARLYAAVLVESLDRALGLLRQATAGRASPSEKLQAILDTLAEFGTSNPEFIPIVMREVASGGRHLPEEMSLRLGAVFRIVGDVLSEGVAQGVFRPTDPLLTHVTLVGALMYLRATDTIRKRVAAAAGLPAADQTPAAIARHVGNLFLHGIEAAPAGPPARRAAATRKRTGGSR